MKKNYLSVFLIVLLILATAVMFGCSNDKDGDTSKRTPDNKPTEAASAEPSPTESQTTPSSEPTPTEDTKTPEGYIPEDKAPAADLFDLVFEDGVAKDASAAKLEITPLNNPNVTEDNSINKTVAEFISGSAGENVMYAVYGFNAKNHEILGKGFTFEVYAKITDDSVYGSLFGYFQAGGVGIDYDPNANNESIAFAVNIDGQYHYLCDEEAIVTDRYYHVVGTYDGSKMCLYYDGLLIASEEIGSPVKFPPDTISQYLGVGGEPGPDRNGENAMNGSLAIARVYSQALNASQVYNLYLDAVKK